MRDLVRPAEHRGKPHPEAEGAVHPRSRAVLAAVPEVLEAEHRGPEAAGIHPVRAVGLLLEEAAGHPGDACRADPAVDPADPAASADGPCRPEVPCPGDREGLGDAHLAGQGACPAERAGDREVAAPQRAADPEASADAHRAVRDIHHREAAVVLAALPAVPVRPSGPGADTRAAPRVAHHSSGRGYALRTCVAARTASSPR